MRITVFIPVFNSEKTVSEVMDRCRTSLEGRGDLDFVLVDDASKDGVWEKIQEQSRAHGDITAIQHASNQGHNHALQTGLRYCEGDWVITLDDDLQHRPEDIPALLDYAVDHDFDVVFGVFDDRRHSAHRNLASKMYLWFFRKATGCSPNITATSFRVMNQRIVERLVAWRLRQPQASYMILRLTSNVGNLLVSHESRKHGASGVTFARALRLGIDSLLYFSSIPLRFAIYLAALISILGMGLGAFYVFAYFTSDSNLMGYTSMVLLILAFGAINLLMTASVGLYVSRVMNEVVAQPAAAVRNSIIRKKKEKNE